MDERHYRNNNFNPTNWEVHYYELFDEHKNYISGNFLGDFGFGLQQYRYVKHGIHIHDKKYYYVVAERALTNDELEKYKPHCQCMSCTAPWYMPWIKLYLYTGCLYSDIIITQDVIMKTIKYVDEQKI